MPSLPPVEVTFSAVGVATVEEGFRTVATAYDELERHLAKGAQAGAAARQKVTQGETKARTKLVHDTATAADKAEQEITRSAEKAARAKIKEAEKASKAEAKEAEKAASAAKKAAKQKADAEIREQARVQAAQDRAQRRLGKVVGTALGGRNGVGGGIGELLRPGGGGVGLQLAGAMAAVGLFKGAIDIATTALKTFGGFILNEVVKPQLDLQTGAAQLANKTGGTMSAADITNKVNAMSVSSGKDPGDIMKILSASADQLGDVSKALKVTELSTKIAKAQGIDANAVGEYVTGQRSKMSDMSDRDFAGLITAQVSALSQGKGGMSFGALAALNAGGTADMLAGDKGAASIATVGLMGLGSKTASPGEAAANLKALFGDMATHDKAKSTVGDSGLLKSPDEAIASLIARVGGSSNKLKAMGFSGESTKFLEPLLAKFNAAESAKKGSGEDAIRDLLREAITPKAGLNLDATNAAVSKVDQTPGEQLAMAVTKLKAAFLPMMPVVEKVIQKLISMEPAIEGLVEDTIIPAMEGMMEWLPLLDLLIPAIRACVLLFDAIKASLALLLSPISLLGYGILKVLEMLPGTGVESGAADKFWKMAVTDPISSPMTDVDRWATAAADRDTGSKKFKAGTYNAAEFAPPAPAAGGYQVQPPAYGPPPPPLDTTKLQKGIDDAGTGLTNLADLVGQPQLPRNTPLSDPFRLNP